jgi:hypothetical protein
MNLVNPEILSLLFFCTSDCIHNLQNSVGEKSHLAIETSGHGALKENHWLDDGAYLMVIIIIVVVVIIIIIIIIIILLFFFVGGRGVHG